MIFERGTARSRRIASIDCAETVMIAALSRQTVLRKANFASLTAERVST